MSRSELETVLRASWLQKSLLMTLLLMKSDQRWSLFPIYENVQILLYQKFITAFIAYLPWIITMSLCKGNSSAAGPGTLTVILPRTPPSINTVWYHSSFDAASLVTPLEA